MRSWLRFATEREKKKKRISTRAFPLESLSNKEREAEEKLASRSLRAARFWRRWWGSGDGGSSWSSCWHKNYRIVEQNQSWIRFDTTIWCSQDMLHSIITPSNLAWSTCSIDLPRIWKISAEMVKALRFCWIVISKDLISVWLCWVTFDYYLPK